MLKMNSVIVTYKDVDEFVDKFSKNEDIIDEWLNHNDNDKNYEVFQNCYLGDNEYLIETIITKKE
jgi:hypothetical protein